MLYRNSIYRSGEIVRFLRNKNMSMEECEEKFKLPKGLIERILDNDPSVTIGDLLKLSKVICVSLKNLIRDI